jgi:hypothetical protein
MPGERAARDDFLAAAEHIRTLMSITDEIDELIPCGWLSKEDAEPIRAIPEFLFSCALDEHALVRTLRDTVDLLLAIFNEDKVAAVLGDDHRIAAARDLLEQTAPASHQRKLEIAIGHITVLVDIIRRLDEGGECKQLVLSHDEDIAEAMDFVRSHTKPEPPDDRPYTIVGFTSVDQFIAHLRDREEQADEGSDYGDGDEGWIEP